MNEKGKMSHNDAGEALELLESTLSKPLGDGVLETQNEGLKGSASGRAGRTRQAAECEGIASDAGQLYQSAAAV